MIQFLFVFFILLIAVWQWDHIESLAMNTGEYIETIRDDIAGGRKPWGKLSIVCAWAAGIALAITLIL